MNNLIGKTLGQYEIISLIGRGGMASVFLARQRSIGRTVAVKVLPQQLLSDETFLKRFQREVQAVSRMQHPRIIPVHDYGEDEGVPYIVMAHIEGGSLAQYIQEKGALPLDEVVRLIDQIAEGLDYAHQQGVIHRDFKPSNVLLDKSNNAYLLDFGIAKVSQETAQLTGSGIVGTPTYMAPEMFKQELPTPAVDIYALGVTLYQMLSGTTPFEGTTPVQLMYSHLNEPVPSIEAVREDIPASVQIVLDKAMAKRPEDRFATAGELADALRRAAEGDTLEFEAPPVVPLTPPPPLITIAPPALPTPAIAAAQTAALGATQPVAEELPPNEQKPPMLEPSRPPEPPQAEAPRKKERRDRHLHPRAGGKGLGCFWTVVVIVLIIMFVGNSISWVRGLMGLGDGDADDTPRVAEGAARPQEISQGLQDATSLEVTLDPGLLGGILKVGSMSSDTNAIEGLYTSSIGGKLKTSYDLVGTTGQLTIERDELNFKPQEGEYAEDLELNLTDEVPIDLIVETGIGEAVLDLQGLNIRSLNVEAGISATTIILPDEGAYEVTIKAGIGKLVVEMPDGLEARVEFSGDLSDITVTNDALEEAGSNKWQTPNYDPEAAAHVRVKIEAGLGSVVID